MTGEMPPEHALLLTTDAGPTHPGANRDLTRVHASRSVVVAAMIASVVFAGCAPQSPAQAPPTSGPVAATMETTTSPRPPSTSVAPHAGSVTRIDDLAVPRAVHTATLLRDGRVLIAGGCSRDGCGGNERAMASELFDPASNEFTPGPSLTTARAGHTATSLLDGRVLIVGGYEAEGVAPLASAEVFDPAAQAVVPTGTLAEGRGGHTANLLLDGRVLIVGGTGSAGEPLESVEIYDPDTGLFGTAAPLPVARASHAAVTVDGGDVLVVGGRSQRRGPVIASTVRYDAAADRWYEAGDLNEARNKHAVVPVLEGGALAIGGATENDFDERLASVELWDPVSSRWVTLGNMAAGRFKLRGAAAALADGRIVVAGGASHVELIDPLTGGISVGAGSLETGALFATATTLADGRVLIAGGYDDEIQVLADAYVYEP
jgi:hypothetical protein